MGEESQPDEHGSVEDNHKNTSPGGDTDVFLTEDEEFYPQTNKTYSTSPPLPRSAKKRGQFNSSQVPKLTLEQTTSPRASPRPHTTLAVEPNHYDQSDTMSHQYRSPRQTRCRPLKFLKMVKYHPPTRPTSLCPLS